MHNSAVRSRESAMIESGRRDPQKLVCLARLERALNALSTRSRCQLGYRHAEDQAGFELALGLSQRIKSPPRSAATVTGLMGGREWLRSTWLRVKSPLPLHSGLRLRVRIGANGRYCPSYHAVIGRGPHFSDSLAWLLFEWCSLTDSNRRMSGRRPDAFAAWRREPELVRRAGLEPATCRS